MFQLIHWFDTVFPNLNYLNFGKSSLFLRIRPANLLSFSHQAFIWNFRYFKKQVECAAKMTEVAVNHTESSRKDPMNCEFIREIITKFVKFFREMTAKFKISAAKLSSFAAKWPRNSRFWLVAVPRNLAQFTATNKCPWLRIITYGLLHTVVDDYCKEVRCLGITL